MDKLHVDGTQMNTPTSSSATTPNFRPASRRTSANIPRESLPTPPPDPRETPSGNSQMGNIFVYPPTKKDLPHEFQSLLNYAEREEEFQRKLDKTIASDCQNLHKNSMEDIKRKGSREEDRCSQQQQQQQHQCQCCDRIRKECDESIEPLQYRLTSTISAALAAHGAIEQLNRLYALWDQYLTLDRQMLQRMECLRYVRALERKVVADLICF